MTTKKTKYDYGECEICGTHLVEKKIKQDFWIKGKLIVVENVPAGVCHKCGEKVVRAEIGRWIAKLIQDSDRIAKAPHVSVPSIKFKTEKVTI
jgi:HTH-type transcriptional regulator/antitoxin MqsA